MRKCKIYPTPLCFKRWSRKKYSVLLSLTRIIKIGVLCLAYSIVNKMPVISAQTTSDSLLKTKEIEEVEITGRRSQLISSEISRMITVISHDEIERAGIQNIVDLLEYVSNTDIRQRGAQGIQADISIRGSSFDHVMILVNGINLSDPQTGHFSLDLPVDFEAVEKIEILEGSAARTLGAGAFMGAVNLITRSGSIHEISASQTFGKYDYRRDHIHAGLSTGKINHFVSASRSASDGYTHNSDYTLNNIYYRANTTTELTSVDFQSGYQYKNFGAPGFYSPRFPDQYEETETWFGSIKASAGKSVKIVPQVYWRRKKDHFLLNRNDPSFYENHHLTDIYGSQLNITLATKKVITTLGFDVRSENILSNNIGLEDPQPKPVRGTDSALYTKQYGRTNFAGFLEFLYNYSNLTVTAGTMVNMNTGFNHGPFLFPGVDISFKAAPRYTIYTSFNRGLHLPTFTDLFYTDPVNQGNTDLDPNRMISFEAGLKYTGIQSQFKIAAFYNSGKNIIDWLWSYTTNRFSPLNLDSYKAWGINSGWKINLSDQPFLNKIAGSVIVNYLFTGINKSIPDSVTKYYNLRHKLSMTIIQHISKGFFLSWKVSYQDRYGEAMSYNDNEGYYSIPYKPYWLLDGCLKWNLTYLQFFLEMSNILNTRYIDAGSVMQPGRWLKAGLVVRFSLQK